MTCSRYPDSRRRSSIAAPARSSTLARTVDSFSDSFIGEHYKPLRGPPCPRCRKKRNDIEGTVGHGDKLRNVLGSMAGRAGVVQSTFTDVSAHTFRCQIGDRKPRLNPLSDLG